MKPKSPENNQRRSRQELKELVLAAGLEVLGQAGSPNPEVLTYKAVFDHLQQTQGLRVTHASVHERIWSSQAVFQIDVLRSAADALPASTFLAAGGAAAAVVETADLTTAEGRLWSTQEMIRVACNADIESDDFTLSTFQAIRQVLARMPTHDPERAELVVTVEATRKRLSDAYLELFHFLVRSLELRVKANLGLTLDHALRSLFAQVVALADGFVLDGPDMNRVMLNTGPDGEPQSWHLYSWGVWCAAHTLLEPDM